MAGDSYDVAVLSDIHFSRTRPYFHFNWEVTLEKLFASPPQLVLVCGDLALDGAHHPDDLSFAREQLDRLPCPWLAVPGNHDVGNNLPDVRGEATVTEARLGEYRRRIGPDFWLHDVGAWRIIGLNSLVCGSGFAHEAEQARFLGEAIATRRDRLVALVYHKPLCNRFLDEGDLVQSFWFPHTRDLLRPHLRSSSISLLLSGHLHESRQSTIEGVANVWAPSIAFVTDMVCDWRPNVFEGRRRVGWMRLALSDAGPVIAVDEPAELLNIDIGGWMRDGTIGHYAVFAGQRPFLGFAAPQDAAGPARDVLPVPRQDASLKRMVG